MRKLGNIPATWSVAKLGDIARVTSGGTPSRKEPSYWGGNVPWVSTGLIDFNTIHEVDEYITSNGVDNSSAKVFPKGTVLMAMFGQGVTRGKVARLGMDSAFNQACVAIVPKNGLSQEYLFQYLRHHYNDIRGLSNSGSQANLNAALIKSISVVIPTKEEIREIVHLAKLWDQHIQETTRLLKLKRRLKRGLMQQLLTGRRRFPKFAGQHWKEVRIGEVLSEQFRPVTWDDAATYRLASVRRNSKGLFWREALKGSQIAVKKLHSIRAGDFLMSHIQAAYGAMAIVPTDFDGGHVLDMYTILSPRHSDDFDVRFFGYLAERAEMKHAAYVSSNGFFAERLRLNFDPHDFLRRKIEIPPTLAEQQKIVAVLAAADREINLLEQQLAALREQKKGLMQKLLTGQIRLNGEMSSRERK